MRSISLYVCLIVIIINVKLVNCIFFNNKIDDKVVSHDLDSNTLYQDTLPVSGFVSGSSTSYGQTVLHLLKRINAPPICNYIKFINAPIDNTGSNPDNLSTLMSAMFEVSKDHHNGRSYWSNGRDILSYVEETNTWIIGYTPGVDSGFVYLKPKDEGLTPVGFDVDEKWYFLSGNEWKKADDVKALCLSSKNDIYDDDQEQGYYYAVEYYDNVEYTMKQSFWIPLLPSSDTNTVTKSNSKLLIKSKKEWIDISKIVTICGFGHPVLINNKVTSNIFHLVNAEHAANPGWRLAFKGTTVVNSNSTEEIEAIFDLSRDGKISDGHTIQSYLSPTIKNNFNNYLASQFININVDEWVWLFYSHVDKDTLIEEKQKVLLRCIRKDLSITLFRFYPNDRVEIMKQTVMSRELEFFTLNSTEGIITMTDNLGFSVKILGAVFIGNDVLSYIKNYLLDKEGQFGDMSSCFMYHASVLIPDPLVYAAEILCLLIGSKPVTMIQFTSSTDQQWKFPLVTELSQAILHAKAFVGDKFDIDYRIHEYRDAETLILYRRHRSYLVDYLLPFNKSQALHPMPYPDNDNPLSDWKKQIYNSWWNGYVLGYPSRFVDSYCESFHNGLQYEDKKIQINKAKIDVKKHFNDNHRAAVEIKYGLDKPVVEEFWKYVKI